MQTNGSISAPPISMRPDYTEWNSVVSAEQQAEENEWNRQRSQAERWARYGVVRYTQVYGNKHDGTVLMITIQTGPSAMDFMGKAA